MICDDIECTIEKYNMLRGVKTVAVGVSGGADSVCLLHFLSKIREKYGIFLCAVHINHNIRGAEAERDENFVRNFCRIIGVECRVFTVDIPALAKELFIGEEECGRRMRYECFNKVGADAIAVAHTLSDSVETVLFNLTRGSGIKGICGIPPTRGNIIRPLIEITREQVESYCFENKLDFVTDSTNLEDEYTRNKIRHLVVPVLKQINPNLEKTVLRFENAVSEDNEFIESQARKLLALAKTQNGYRAEPFKQADNAVVKRALAYIIDGELEKPIEARHIELCLNMIRTDGKIEIAKDLYISSDGDIITIHSAKQKAKPWQAELFENVFVTPYGKYSLEKRKVSEISADEYDSAVAAETVCSKLVLRSRRPGDRFTDYRRKNTKTIKKLFNEVGIPPEEREKRAVLCCDDDVLWVQGFGVDMKHRINKKSECAYIIKERDF